MPEICRFDGIIISMYFNEHAPPHFHVRFRGRKASVAIDTGEVRGRIDPATLRKVNRWRRLRLEELRHVWRLAELELPLERISPLP